MNNQFSKLIISILLSLVALIGCNSLKKDPSKKQNSPVDRGNSPQNQDLRGDKNNSKEPPVSSNNGETPKSEQAENQAGGDNKTTDTAGKAPSGRDVDIDEVIKEIGDENKEIGDFDNKLDTPSINKKLELMNLKSILESIESIKKIQASNKRSEGQTGASAKIILEGNRKALQTHILAVQDMFNAMAKIQNHNEFLKPLKVKILKLFLKQVSDIVPIDIEILMKATKLTREEIEALKRS